MKLFSNFYEGIWSHLNSSKQEVNTWIQGNDD